MSENGETRERAGTILGRVEADSEVFRRAAESRDARFDGRFFVGVHSTGIYCRPICPAPAAKPENVRYYPTAAAAEAAGLRACRRCRPEAAPGTPEWLGGSALVARATRLISDGFLDRRPVGALAAEVCVGERQMRRLFVEHLGASPLAIARRRRLDLARLLLGGTSLSVTEVARASGFASLRAFNAAVRQAFGRSPSELRRASRAPRGGELELRLAYRPPLDWDSLYEFLAFRAVPGVEETDGGLYRRAVRAGGQAAVVEVEPIPGAHEVALRVAGGPVEALAGVVARARAAFDLDADPVAVAGVLHGLASERGVRVPGTLEPFELAVRAVLGQQVSVAAARTLAGRLAARFGDPLPESRGGVHLLFPDAAALADADVASVGLPRPRAETIRELAIAVASGHLRLDPAADLDEVRARLGALPGVGPWTVEYVAMRALRDPDAFPSGDLGLRQALAAGARLPTAREVERLAAAWRPWRAYAAVALWRRLSEPVALAA
jgi:AraC family transcriptional regulator of adaptative response / DNA-3-methyladenine glycosylase II